MSSLYSEVLVVSLQCIYSLTYLRLADDIVIIDVVLLNNKYYIDWPQISRFSKASNLLMITLQISETEIKQRVW